MKTESDVLREKPLSGSSRFFLFLGAGGIILLSYAVSSVFAVLLVGLLLCEFIVVVAAARFGLVRLVGGIINSHGALLAVFFRSVWLKKGAEFRIKLQPQDAPALFDVLKTLCQMAQVEMPHEVLVDMTVNAFVSLKGYRRGAGRTVLGVGYDLLAGLSQWEMEGVLAHEITHAKLVQRGYNKWLNRGLGRIWQLQRGLNAHIEKYRRASRTVEPAGYLFRVTDTLGRSAARLVASCSRQDEFDADRGAAALCGAGAIRSSLLKLEPLGRHAARLPWNERVARLQAGEGFSEWLVGELAAADFKREEKAEAPLFFKYSTHPNLADRLAALPADASEPLLSSPPAITLLKEPDKVAEALISEIQKIAAEEERKDSKRLKRWSKKTNMHARLRPLQSFGVLLILIGGVIGLFMLFDWMISFPLMGAMVGAIGLGVLGFHFGKFRERLPLTVPDYSILKNAWQNPPKFNDAQVKAMEAEIQARVPANLNNHQREMHFASIAYQHLARCDYVRAHIAARFCLQVNRKSTEGVAALAVAAAALHQVQQVHQSLNYLQRTVGMKVPSIAWSAAWALVLCGDWMAAEAFLENLCQQKSKNPTQLMLLAMCQSNRGKLQSALLSARQACELRPHHKEQARFLVDLLLQAGYLREAREWLKQVEPGAQDDVEVMLSIVRLNLLQRNFIAADEWSGQMRAKQPSPHLFVRLGQSYEVARQYQKAANFYNEALAAGFYPESLLGLGRIEAHAKNKEQAKKHLMAALDTARPLGQKAVGPLPLFHRIAGQLLALEDPVANCRAWVASLNGGKSPPGLANKSLLIYAPGRSQAEQFLNEIVCAMQPGMPPIMPANIGWKEAEKEKQPDGPVRPGIQAVLN